MRISSLPLTVVALLISHTHAVDEGTSDADQSLFWGPYRPNLYFGLRPKVPNTLMTGLMWHSLDDFQVLQKARHSCEQGDNFAGYTWSELDIRYGGIQTLNDTEHNVQITTEWLKVPGGPYGGGWAARIKGQPLRTDKPLKTSVYFYAGVDGLGSLDLDNEEDDDGLTGPIKIVGSTPDLGEFSLRIVDGKSSKYVTEGPYSEDFEARLGKTSYAGMALPAGSVWRAKDMILGDVVQNAQKDAVKYQEGVPVLPEPAFLLTLPNEILSGASTFAFQKAFEGEFSFDVFYDAPGVQHSLDAAALDSGITAFRANFDSRFRETFPLVAGLSAEHVSFAKAITSNLLGGIGYFYGDSIEDRSFKHEWDDDDKDGSAEDEQRGEPRLVEPRGLFTATPSRSFFPRGFYWDEGFHLLVVGQWDNDLSLEILKSWIDLVDEDGWVGREQILGEEARSKVPQEFQTQYPNYANPPTLTMAATAFIERLLSSDSDAADPLAHQLGFDVGGTQVPLGTSGPSPSDPASSKLLNPTSAREYLRSIYPSLVRHFEWFRRTQRGQVKTWGRKATSPTEAYRWRGRTEQHVLTSGLDDYPRAVPPHQGELHVDLLSWMGFFARTMTSIAKFLDESDDAERFQEIQSAIVANLDDLHWSKVEQMYCDLSVDEDDDSIHVCNPGYISLFPFLLGLLPPSSPHLGAIFEMIRDPAQLWSDYGIRSLSQSHELFGQGENYWRGPIWVQMNYLALSALYKTYIPHPGPHQAEAKKLYDELRSNIVNNVFKEYQRTGFVWEQYDALTGEGRRSHPFTGWTSLVVLIMAEKY